MYIIFILIFDKQCVGWGGAKEQREKGEWSHGEIYTEDTMNNVNNFANVSSYVTNQLIDFKSGRADES